MNRPPNNPERTAPITIRMRKAGIAAITHLTMNTTMDQKLMLISVTTTSVGLSGFMRTSWLSGYGDFLQ
mgnify:CR=1 FL=1